MTNKRTYREIVFEARNRNEARKSVIEEHILKLFWTELQCLSNCEMFCDLPQTPGL